MQRKIDHSTYGSMEKGIQAGDSDANNDDDSDDHVHISRRKCGLCRKVATFMCDLRVGPIAALYMLGASVSAPFIQNVIIEKICLNMNQTLEVCERPLNESLEAEVQSVAAQYMMVLYMLRLVPGMVISLVIGHWSDVHGRKQIIIAALTTNIITCTLYCVNSVLMVETPAIYMVLSTLPVSLSGDYVMMMFGIFAIVRDTTPVAADLIVKIAIVDGVIQVCWQFGPLIGAQLYARFGYIPTFGTTIAILMACVMYVALRIKEPQFESTSWKRTFLDFVDIKSFFKNFTVLTDRREGNRRAYIFVNLTGIMLVSVPLFGIDEIMYLYGRLMFQWDVVMYTYFTVYDGSLQAVVLLIIMPAVVKYFKTSDTILTVIAAWTCTAWFLAIACVRTVGELYAVRIIGLMAGFTIVSFRSMTLKCVNETEVGKIAAIYSIAQTLGQILGRIVATQIYVATLNSFPAAFFVFGAGVSGVVGIILIMMYCDIKRKKETDF